MNTDISPRFVVILGAARSGTSMLRDLIATHPAVAAVPFDVSHVWRIGNDRHVDDVLRPDTASDAVRATIRARLIALARRNAGSDWDRTSFIVEKTVGNALRPDYVDAVLPGAIFVRLVRDPRHVIASTVAAWRSPPDSGHLMRKLRVFGPSDVGYMGWYAVNALKGRVNHKRGLQIWGVRYPGIRQDLESETLETVCARQWLASVQTIDRFMDALPPSRSISVSYEALVGGPHELQRIWSFLGLEDGAHAATIFSDRVRPSPNRPESLPDALSRDTRNAVEAQIAHYGYV